MPLNEIKNKLQIRNMMVPGMNLLALSYVSHLYDFYFPIMHWLCKFLSVLWNFNDCFYILSYQFLFTKEFICNMIRRVSYTFTHQLCIVSGQTALALDDHKPLIDNVSNSAVFVVCTTIQQQLTIFLSIETFFGYHPEIKL